MRAHDYSLDGLRRRLWSLLGCINGEGDGPEAVVVGALGMVEQQLPRLDHHNTVREEG